MRAVLLIACIVLAWGQELTLRAPLATLAEIEAGPGPVRLTIELEVPADAPPDLGLGVFAADRDGRWWQRPLASPLAPGRHHHVVDLIGSAPLAAEPPPASWALARRTGRAGIYLWSNAASAATVKVQLMAAPLAAVATPGRLVGVAPGPRRLAVGERYEVTVRPDPWPADPWGDEVALSLRIIEPDGGERTVTGFVREPMQSRDRGDAEEMLPTGPLVLAARFRPRQPGTHRLELRATWPDGRRAACLLPEVQADGPPGDGIVRVDPADPRFFSVDGRFWWPIGLNLHNSFDIRSQQVNRTRLTPARGSLTYRAILDRLALAGGDATEIWMSAWNLALVWNEHWPGYHGLHGPNLANAERLDAVLDHAWSRGVRVKLVVNNHGQASPRTDREWKDSPLNAANGGPCDQPAEVFTHPEALAHQDRVRRYIVARWADHPAVWGWKVWSEVDLTAGRGQPLVDWHAQAAARWLELDPSGRAVTTHWSGDYRRADPAICALPAIGYIALDAYRRARDERDPSPLADILAGSLHDPTRGLLRFAKPVLVTEFGASSGASPEDFRAIDHHIGAWVGLVSGHAAAPMLWWWEWVDQGDRWQPYRAISAFVVGEDLRGVDARSIVVDAETIGARLWSRAWVMPGRMLGYILHADWGNRGGAPPTVAGARLRVGSEVAAGAMSVSWWDADHGVEVARALLNHAGGALELEVPAFAGHLAWKLERR